MLFLILFFSLMFMYSVNNSKIQCNPLYISRESKLCLPFHLWQSNFSNFSRFYHNSFTIDKIHPKVCFFFCSNHERITFYFLIFRLHMCWNFDEFLMKHKEKRYTQSNFKELIVMWLKAFWVTCDSSLVQFNMNK